MKLQDILLKAAGDQVLIDRLGAIRRAAGLSHVDVQDKIDGASLTRMFSDFPTMMKAGPAIKKHSSVISDRIAEHAGYKGNKDFSGRMRIFAVILSVIGFAEFVKFIDELMNRAEDIGIDTSGTNALTSNKFGELVLSTLSYKYPDMDESLEYVRMLGVKGL